MGAKKAFLMIISVLITLLIPVILYLSAFSLTAFDLGFYKKEFSKYNVYNSLDDYDVEKINKDVLTYLRYNKNNELLGNSFFNEREQLHLLDVKKIIQNTLAISYISLILLLFLLVVLAVLMGLDLEKISERILLIIFLGSLLTLLDGFLFFILSNMNFDFVFSKFHEAFFPVGTYTFNPEIEKIVVLYPQELFFDALTSIVVKAILSSVILAAVAMSILIVFYKNDSLKFFSVKYRRQK